MRQQLFPLCTPTTDPLPVDTISLDNFGDWQLRFFGVGEWPLGLPFWLRSGTLLALRKQLPDLATRAIVLHHQPSGRSVYLSMQDLHFAPRDQISGAAKGVTSSYDIRRRLLGVVPSKVLAIGQLLSSGSHAQYGLEQLAPHEAAPLLHAVANTLLRRGSGYRGVLLKDLFPAASPVAVRLSDRGYTPLPTDPVMELEVVWSSLAAYLNDLSSKYRVRYRRARSKLQPLVRRRLPPEEVTTRLQRIYALYRMTLRGAVVNFTTLPPDYFSWLGRVAALHGYFAGEQLVGFTTGIDDGDRYQAHYLGFTEEANQRHHLYHNMLFDLLEDAIAGGYAVLDYGRTALEIKSSVGAEPHLYTTLLRLRNPVLNYLVPRFVPAVFTPAPWRQRHPFRTPDAPR